MKTCCSISSFPEERFRSVPKCQIAAGIAARLTTWHCAPSCKSSITNMQNCLVLHLIGTKLCCALLTNLGPPCASWCTMQLDGVQGRLVVHNVVLYRWGSAQRWSHKQSQTNTWTLIISFGWIWVWQPHGGFKSWPITTTFPAFPTGKCIGDWGRTTRIHSRHVYL